MLLDVRFLDFSDTDPLSQWVEVYNGLRSERLVPLASLGRVAVLRFFSLRYRFCGEMRSN